MTNEQFEIFKKNEKTLEGIVQSSSSANSEDIEARRNYRNYASKLASVFSNGTVQIDDSTPASVIDRIYNAALEAYGKTSIGYFHDNRAGIIAQAPAGKLAKNILGIQHTEVDGNKAHNSAVRAIQEYAFIKSTNNAFENDLPIGQKGKKVTEKDLIGIASNYVLAEVSERYDPKKEENKYIDDEARKLIAGALISILSSSPRAARVVTELIEKKKEAEYKAILSTDEKKAEVARTSLLNLEDENLARQLLHQATK